MDNSIRYSVRISQKALDEIDATASRFALLEGERISQEWLEGLRAAIAGFVNPRQHPIIPEAKFFPNREIRQFVYRRKTYAVAYRILFSVNDETPEGPLILIFHVRHAARRPLSQTTARQITIDE